MTSKAIYSFSPADVEAAMAMLKRGVKGYAMIAHFGFSSLQHFYRIRDAYLSKDKSRFHLRFYEDDLKERFAEMTIREAYHYAVDNGYFVAGFDAFRNQLKKTSMSTKCNPKYLFQGQMRTPTEIWRLTGKRHSRNTIAAHCRLFGTFNPARLRTAPAQEPRTSWADFCIQHGLPYSKVTQLAFDNGMSQQDVLNHYQEKETACVN